MHFGFARSERNTEPFIDLKASNLMRFPCEVLCFTRFPRIDGLLLRIQMFKFVGESVFGMDIFLQLFDYRYIPSRVEIWRVWGGIHGYAIPAFIRVRRSMQRLMNITHKVNQKCQVAITAPFVTIAFFETSGVFVDLCRNASSARTACRQISALVLQANINEMPTGG